MPRDRSAYSTRKLTLEHEISGVDFDAAWPRRLMVTIEGRTLAVLSREDFIVNKRAAGRPTDLLDLALLDEADAP